MVAPETVPFTFSVPFDMTVSAVPPTRMVALLPVATVRPPAMLPDVLSTPDTPVTLTPLVMLLPVRVAVPLLTLNVPNDALELPRSVEPVWTSTRVIVPPVILADWFEVRTRLATLPESPLNLAAEETAVFPETVP